MEATAEAAVCRAGWAEGWAARKRKDPPLRERAAVPAPCRARNDETIRPYGGRKGPDG